MWSQLLLLSRSIPVFLNCVVAIVGMPRALRVVVFVALVHCLKLWRKSCLLLWCTRHVVAALAEIVFVALVHSLGV